MYQPIEPMPLSTSLTPFRFILFSVFLLAQFTSLGQVLKKRGQLGIAAVALTDSLAQISGLTQKQGVWVRQVIGGSTAEQIGIRPGDVVIQINQQAITTPTDLMAFAQQVVEGDSLHIALLRRGNRQTLRGLAKPRPIPLSADLALTYDHFSFTDNGKQAGHIRTIVKRAKTFAGQKLPVVYFIQGTSCLSMAYLPDGDPYKLATDELARRGFAVFMVEKPGIGDNTGTASCQSTGFNTELAAFTQGYKRLLTYDWVDTSRIFLFGHSLGGITAPLLAQTYRPRGIIVFGGVLRTWHDYMVDVIRDQKILEGAEPAQAEADLQALRPFLYGYFYQRQSPKELVSANPSIEPLVRRLLDYESDSLIFSRHYTFWQELNAHNLYAAWQTINTPVLALYGEADINALKPDDHLQITAIVNRQHPGLATYQLVEKTNHSMQLAGTMAAYLQHRHEAGQQYPLNTRMFDDIVKWIRQIG